MQPDLRRGPFERVVYLGDGRGDFCGVMHAVTRQTDVVMARKGYKLEGTPGAAETSATSSQL